MIGEQLSVAQVGGQEAQNRFNLVFQNFIKAICQAEHPLVFFIDDLQWADSASLKLLKIILGDRNIQNLLIVGAYRDNEVDSIHPLVMTLDEIEKEGGSVSKIHLKNLTPKDVNALIAEALGCSTIFSQPLTNLVCEKTQGNAFFITEFLKSLYTDMLLSLDYSKKQWRWDLEQIQAKEITDNVVELMTIKIVNLAEGTQKNLQLAACIGNNFDLSTLAVISQQSVKQVLDHLLPALQEGLIVQVQNKIAVKYLAIYWQLTLNLLGATENTCLLSGAAYREEQMLFWHRQASDRNGLAHLYFSKLVLCYLFQDFPQAAANAQELEKYLNAVMAGTMIPHFNLYDSLTALALYSEALPSAQKGLLEKVTVNQAKMQKWAQHAPMNILHKLYLVEAERYRVLGQKAEAIEMYDRAIAKATVHEYLNEQAIANELAARFYFQWGKDRIAQDYLLNACYAYTHWGAKAKVADLKKCYPQFFTQAQRNSQFSTFQTISTSSTTPSTSLDLNSVLKASHILGRETSSILY